MHEIDKENTSLSKLGLSYDMIMQDGERVEIEPVAKTSKKEKYIEFPFANTLIDAYADDLEDAYHVIEALLKENVDLKEDNENIRTSDMKKTTQLKKVLDGDGSFKQAETLLAQLDQQMEALEKSKKQDKITIQKLQEAVALAQSELATMREQANESESNMEELQQLRNDVPKMREDIQRIIDALFETLQEAGIDLED